MGVPPSRAAEVDLVVVAVRLPFLELERADVLLLEVVLPPAGFLVVAILFFVFPDILLPGRHRSLLLVRPNSL
jgi:hypothetical protein